MTVNFRTVVLDHDEFRALALLVARHQAQKRPGRGGGFGEEEDLFEILKCIFKF